MSDENLEEFESALRELVSLTGNTEVLHEIAELNRECINLLQVLEQSSNIHQVETILHDNEPKLRNEIQWNVRMLQASRLEVSADFTRRRVRLEKEIHDRRSHLEKVNAEIERIKREKENAKEDIKASYDNIIEIYEIDKRINERALDIEPLRGSIDQDYYRSRVNLIENLIHGLNRLFNKYIWKKRRLFLAEQSIRIFWLLVILTLLPGILLAGVEPWFVSLLLIPCLLWFLTDRFFQPYLEEHLFTSNSRNNLKLLIKTFYSNSILLRCELVLIRNAFPEEDEDQDGEEHKGE